LTAEYSANVQAGVWYYDGVMKAKTTGLLDSFTDADFNPDTSGTREEMAVTEDFIDLSTAEGLIRTAR